jgi:hypothetical protein
MARPKLDLTGKRVGTFDLGERVPDTPHARYTYTCLSCNNVGEVDARYIHRGCPKCTKNRSRKQFQMMTHEKLEWVQHHKLVVAFRANPDATFFLNNKRVRLQESDEHIMVIEAERYGVPVITPYLKAEQDLEGQTLLAPSVYKSPDTAPQTLKVLVNTPAPPPPEEFTLPQPSFTPPPDWLKLERPADAVWLGQDYPAGMPPQYLAEWFDKFPEADYRTVSAGGDMYAAATVKPQKVAMSFYSDEDEATALQEAAQAAAQESQAMADAEAARQAAMRPKELAAYLAKIERTKAANKQHAAWYKEQAHPTEENKAEHEALKHEASILHARYIAAQNEADIEEDLENVPKPKELDTRTPEQRFLDNTS